MSTITDLTVAPEGMSALRCAVCQEFITLAQETMLETAQSTPCLDCGEEMYRYEMECAIRTQDAPILDARVAKATTWYHATTRTHWMKDLLSGKDIPWVHIGSLEAARDRARVGGTGEIVKDHFLYRLRLKPEATINPHIFRDENDWPDHVGQTGLGWDSRMNYANANRYLNTFEAPGSISLLIDPRVLEITGKTIIKSDRLAARKAA